MKKLSFFIVIVFFIAACNNSEAPKEEVEKSDLQLVELQIQVDGMTCGGCENTIETELLKLSGVGEVQASHVDKLVIVKVDTLFTKLNELENGIDKVGYTVIK